MPETRSDVQTRSTLRSRVLAAMGSLLIVMSLGAPIPALAEGNPAGAATKLAFVGQLANSGPGAPIIDSTCGGYDMPSVTCLGVAVEDANGVVVGTDQTTRITVAIGANPGGGILTNGGPVTVVNGVARFSATSINKVGNQYTLVASSTPSYTTVTSNTFDIISGEPDHLAFTPSPGGGAPNAAWAVQPVVSIVDANGYPVGVGTDTITIWIPSGVLPAGAKLTCTGGLSMKAVSGVATFAGCAIDKLGDKYILAAATDGAFTRIGTSNIFAITNGPAPTPSGTPAPWPSSPPRPVPTPVPSPYVPPGAAPASPAPSGAPASPLKIGDPYGGGTVFYILQPGDIGYLAGDTRALVAAGSDATLAGFGIPWALFAFQQIAVPKGTETGIGTGAKNTDSIVEQNGASIWYAAGTARAYRGGGYADWYLPSQGDMNQLWKNEWVVNGLPAGSYWTSSQDATSPGNKASSKLAVGLQDTGLKSLWLAVRPIRSVSVRSDKDITSFTFAGLSRPPVSVIDQAAHTIAVNVPLGTDLTALVASFTFTGTKVGVGATVQVSGTTANDFTKPVTYTVTAADGSTQKYTVTVTPGLAIGDHFGGGIVAYILQPWDPGYVAGETKGLIAATEDQSGGIAWAVADYQGTLVPKGTDTKIGSGAKNTDNIIDQNGRGTGYAAGLARAYRGGGFTDWYLPSRDELNQLWLNRDAIGGFGGWFPSYWSSSEWKQWLPGTDPAATGLNYSWNQRFDLKRDAQNASFKSDDSQHVRAVRSFSVTSDKAITAFSFAGLPRPAVGLIDPTAHTVAVTVPYGTDLAALVATFTVSGYGALVGTIVQASGTTPNDFTKPVTYTVLAADGSKATWTVTVTAPLAVGDAYGGGIVAYILQPGDPGYEAGKTKGLIAAAADQSAAIPWWNGTYSITSATGTALGTGSADTTAIITVQGPTATAYAAGLARASIGGGYTDWYLPSQDELNKLYLNKAKIGGLTAPFYWSSSESDKTTAVAQRFDTGFAAPFMKSFAIGVRAVRAFPAKSAKEITTFSFADLSPAAVGVIDQGAHTIAVHVPPGTAVSALVATFTTTGTSVKVGATEQVSATTANGFTTPVAYTVTGSDGSTVTYTVTVTSGLAIGDAYEGGVIAYILAPGDPGYVAGETRGLIAATTDQGASVPWALGANQTTAVPGGTGTAIGTGSANTDAIIAQNGGGTGYAAGVAAAYRGGGYTDWYLPSKDELNKLYANKAAIGGLAHMGYWSSSQYTGSVSSTTDANSAWTQWLNDAQIPDMKLFPAAVRAVRAFPPGSKAITSFTFAGLPRAAVGVIDQGAHTVAVKVVLGTDVTALVATFTTTGTSVKVGATVQVSGTTPNDFTTPVTYTVTAADGSIQDYTVTVTPGLAVGDHYGGGIIGYILRPGDPGYVAGKPKGLVVSEKDLGAAGVGTPWAIPAHQAQLVPGGTSGAFGSGAENTRRIIAQNGAGTGYAAGVARAYRGGGFTDWYLPSTDELMAVALNRAAITAGGGAWSIATWSSTEYTATDAWDVLSNDWGGGTTNPSAWSKPGLGGPRVYAVRSFAVTSDAAITAFSFAGLSRPAIGVIDPTAHTIAVNVPLGTTVSSLVATFTTTGYAAKVGATVQASGTTPNDFTTPVTYTVIAGDGSTVTYVVTVTPTSAPTLNIGDAYGGGIVAYILQPGDPGYVAGETKGIIAATADQAAAIPWALPAYQTIAVPGGTGTAIGTGSANTDAIITQNIALTGYAAGVARAHRGGGYADWYLPSKDELNKLYLNKAKIGGLTAPFYWSSSGAPTSIAGTTDGNTAWSQASAADTQTAYFKLFTLAVRAVRAFSATSAVDITAFSFAGLARPAAGVIDQGAHTIAVHVSLNTAVNGLVATFTTTGTSVKVGAAVQVSGTTLNNFMKPVTYTVTGSDGSTVTYLVTVTAGLGIGDAYEGGIIAYLLAPGDPGYVAGETRGLIAATTDATAAAGIPWAVAANQATAVPGGTGTAIGTGSANTDAIIAQNGGGTGYAAGVAAAYRGGGYTDWYLPSKDELNKLYANKAAIDGLTASFYWSSSEGGATTASAQAFANGSQAPLYKSLTLAVRAVRAFPPGSKSITSFTFAGLRRAAAVIDQGAHTIAVNVPLETDLTALVATFTTTGTSVGVGATVQVSGTTPNDFTTPVTYTVTAADGSTQNYTVTVTPGLAVGDHYGGGIIGYILRPGDPGYVAGKLKGLVVSEKDLGAAGGGDVPWALTAYQQTEVPGAAGSAIGTGLANTEAIIAQNGAGTGYAAGVARAYRGGGYTDWYLPSTDELMAVASNRAAIIAAGGGGWEWARWSSTTNYLTQAFDVVYIPEFDYTTASEEQKSHSSVVRAVRSFTVTSAKAITAFSFAGLSRPAAGVIDQVAHTIAVAVPLGTNVSTLVATFTTTGYAAKVGAAVQVSGTTRNDFTTPVTYTVIAGDGSTVTYTVTVTSGLGVGDAYGGGIVAYILQPGDPGYEAGKTKGLIAATADATAAAGIPWALATYLTTAVPGGTGTAIGTGSANTDRIIAQNIAVTGYAAAVARAYRGGGFSDWYLPSKDELNKLYLNKAAIGGLTSNFYWSSSGAAQTIAGTTDGNTAWSQAFVAGALAAAGTQTAYFKLFPLGVRAVRSFTATSDAAITAFSFSGLSPAVVGVIDQGAHTIAVTVPHGTRVKALVATFTTTGMSVGVGAAVQASGTTPNDFTTPVTYTVTAADGSTVSYTVTVTVTPGFGIGDAFEGGIVAYILQPGDPGYEAGKTKGLIAATENQGAGVPWALERYTATPVPTGTAIGTGSANTDNIIAQNGAGIGYAAGVARAYTGGGYTDWYLPSRDEMDELRANQDAIGGFVRGLYWTSSEGGFTKSYYDSFAGAATDEDGRKSLKFLVRAVRAFPPSSAKEIRDFSFEGLSPAAAGAIDPTAHTIAVAVPHGTDLTALVATFAATGTSVKVGTAVQVSGTTPNAFTTPVTYTVTAADGSTQDYTVTVTPGLGIGDPYGGGIVAYILQAGDPGYVAGETRGLIAATEDQSARIAWALKAHASTAVPKGTGTALGTGSANTDRIIAQNGAGIGYAAGLARAYRGGGYTDWYLPSTDELNELYVNRAAIGGFEASGSRYWSSSQGAKSFASVRAFDDGASGAGSNPKSNSSPRVRAVRSFAVTPLPRASTLTLAPVTTVVTAGDAVTLTATLHPAGAGRPIVFERSTDAGVTWASVGTATTAPGTASLTFNPQTNATYRATYAGAADLAAATSSAISIDVHLSIILRPIATIDNPIVAERISYYSVAGIVTFTATVGPVGPAIPLPTMTFVFYKKSGGNWVFNFSKTVTASADGTADAATGSQIPMDFYVVVSAEATTANLASAKSNKVYMTVR